VSLESVPLESASLESVPLESVPLLGIQRAAQFVEIKVLAGTGNGIPEEQK
jgi:hypothetical protein